MDAFFTKQHLKINGIEKFRNYDLGNKRNILFCSVADDEGQTNSLRERRKKKRNLTENKDALLKTDATNSLQKNRYIYT
jgi:arginine utilization protein RocB